MNLFDTLPFHRVNLWPFVFTFQKVICMTELQDGRRSAVITMVESLTTESLMTDSCRSESCETLSLRCASRGGGMDAAIFLEVN